MLSGQFMPNTSCISTDISSKAMISTEYMTERASSLHLDVDLVSSGRVNHADEQSPLPAAGTVETS